MAKIKLIKKPKKEEIEKDGRGNIIPPAGIKHQDKRNENLI